MRARSPDDQRRDIRLADQRFRLLEALITNGGQELEVDVAPDHRRGLKEGLGVAELVDTADQEVEQ